MLMWWAEELLEPAEEVVAEHAIALEEEQQGVDGERCAGTIAVQVHPAGDVAVLLSHEDVNRI